MIKLHSGLGLSEIDGETVILDSRSGRYYALNGTGSRMLALVLEKGSVAAMLEAMSAEYDVPEDVLAKDWDALRKELSSRNLLESGA
ncbi:MAG TPA: PqqD family protein [Treponemataceae bacterium]|jgi:hypothetical protein|nr:MAG: PqqD family protein [Treponema sp.]HOC30178.1 PqqD family protein [Treponemataceae bacterium]HQL32597.1 PqqD family protein [Treponemataceae bacterium]